MDIGDRIKRRREELGMSQEELAKKVGYKSRSSVNKIEIDGRGLPQNKIVLFAKALETTPAYLMGWEELDSYFSGREASNETYRKFADNIERHHGRTKELLNIYSQLSDENKDKTLQYSKNLLSIQQMDSELLVNAAHHSRGNFTDEDRQADEDMLD